MNVVWELEHIGNFIRLLRALETALDAIVGALFGGRGDLGPLGGTRGKLRGRRAATTRGSLFSTSIANHDVGESIQMKKRLSEPEGSLISD